MPRPCSRTTPDSSVPWCRRDAASPCRPVNRTLSPRPTAGDTGHLGDDRPRFRPVLRCRAKVHLAQRLDDRDRALEQEIVGLGHLQVFRAHAEACRLALSEALVGMSSSPIFRRERDGGLWPVAVIVAGMTFMAGEPMKRATKRFARPLVGSRGAPTCSMLTGGEEPRSGRPAHRLHLVMGDVDHGGVRQPLAEACAISMAGPTRSAASRVLRAARRKGRLGIAADRPADGHALAAGRRKSAFGSRSRYGVS